MCARNYIENVVHRADLRRQIQRACKVGALYKVIDELMPKIDSDDVRDNAMQVAERNECRALLLGALKRRYLVVPLTKEEIRMIFDNCIPQKMVEELYTSQFNRKGC